LGNGLSGKADIANGQSGRRLEFGIIIDCLTKRGIGAAPQQRRDLFDGRANEALAAGMDSGRS
jgi:hypothetical protein